MDIVTTTTTFRRTPVLARDPAKHRQAYLDTYAKRRATSQPFNRVRSGTSSSNKTIDGFVKTSVPTNLKAQTLAAPQNIQVKTKLVDNFSYNPESLAKRDEKIQSTPVKTVSSSDYISNITKIDRTKYHNQQIDNSEVPKVDEVKIEANLRALYLDEDSLAKALSDDSSSSSVAHIRAIVASAFACGIIAVSLFSFFSQANSHPVVAQPIGAPVIEVAPSPKAPSKNAKGVAIDSQRVAINASHPVNILISSIGVNAPVEGVGQTAEGLMDVPKSYGVVGWYNKGAVPGQNGPAVLAGHYTGGYGGVFDKLAELKNGDLVTTTNGKGQSFTYRVVKKVEYEKDKVPMNELFKKSNSSRLEIITCSGKWQANNYNKRLVVTAELVK